MIDAETQNASIVLIGQFNPAIFSPAWLMRVGLAREGETDTAEVEVIHPELTKMKVGAFSLQIAPSRLAVGTSEAPFVQVEEFASELIGNILPHTPIQAMGINFEEHFVTASPQQRIALGRALAPVGPWGDWGRAIEASPIETPSGLKTLSMQETQPDGREGGWFGVEIGPSPEINKFQAVKMSSNDHYPIHETVIASSAEIAAATLAENFEISQKKAMSIFAQIRELAERATHER